jgi:hypothetical protein
MAVAAGSSRRRGRASLLMIGFMTPPPREQEAGCFLA